MLTQPLTRPLTRKIHRAQLTSIRYRDFDPLSLEPYLLFDAESSMLGNLENPTLDLDASDNGSLDVITATRAGIATYTAADGQIVTADENTVRVDWSLGYPAMLIEPSATNLLDYSEDFSNSYWTKQNVTLSPAPVAAPDGTMTATHATKTNDECIVYRGGFQSGTDILSIWARTVSGSGTCYFGYQGGSATPVTVTDQWQRFEVPLNNPNAYVVNLRGASTLDELYIWGAQVETGSVATSYIPTSGGSVAERTRNADNLVIDGTNFSNFYNATEGTVYGEFSSKSTVDTALAEFRYLNSSNRIVTGYISPNSPWVGLLNTFNGSLDCALTAHSAPLDGTIMRGGFSYKQNNYKSSINGASELSDTSVSVPVNINEIRIGKQGVNNLNGHIKRLIYWPTHSSSL